MASRGLRIYSSTLVSLDYSHRLPCLVSEVLGFPSYKVPEMLAQGKAMVFIVSQFIDFVNHMKLYQSNRSHRH